MQVQKEELRQNILDAAKQEFIAKGYENSSMRLIAKKANTTLGNLYHYFDGKEDILTVLLAPALQNLELFCEEHLEQNEEFHSIEDIVKALDEIGSDIERTELNYVLDDTLLILFDLKTTHFVEVREAFLKKCKAHMQFHLKIKDQDSKYLDIIVNMFVDCIRHVLIEQKNPEEARAEFMKVFRLLCTGIIAIDE